jgi:chromosomal replication initiator protein
VRQIEGTVKKLYALQQLTGEPATISAATRAISDIRTDDMPTPVTVERILEEVARTYNLTAGDLLSRNQSKNISHARKAAMYIIREIKQMTLLEIGKLFEKDHSSVVYSLKSFTNAVEHDPHELSVVNDIIKNISNL